MAGDGGRNWKRMRRRGGGGGSKTGGDQHKRPGQPVLYIHGYGNTL